METAAKLKSFKIKTFLKSATTSDTDIYHVEWDIHEKTMSWTCDECGEYIEFTAVEYD